MNGKELSSKQEVRNMNNKEFWFRFGVLISFFVVQLNILIIFAFYVFHFIDCIFRGLICINDNLTDLIIVICIAAIILTFIICSTVIMCMFLSKYKYCSNSNSYDKALESMLNKENKNNEKEE